MSTTDPASAKRFRASTFGGNHQAQVQAAINAAQTYVANNPNAADLFDDSPRLYTLQNTDAKAAGAKAGPNGLQAIAEDDVGGVMQVTNQNCLIMGNNVRLEFSKDCSLPQPTTTLVNFIKVEGKSNFTITTKAGVLQTARPTGSNAPHSDWSIGKAIIDLRGHAPKSGSGLGIENNRFSSMDGVNGGGPNFFKYENLLIIGNNDCAAPGWKQNTSFFTPRGPDQTAACRNGIFINLDFDGCYSGYGAWQNSSVWRCLFANIRSHGGTLFRNESDGHFSGGRVDNYGVSQVDAIAFYGEDMNKVGTMQPNVSKNFVSWYSDGWYGIGCLEVANCGQFNGGAGTVQTFARSFWGEIWGLTGDHSAWQEQSPCMSNDSVAIYAQSGGPLPGSIWQSMRYNLGHRGGPGHGVDGSGAEIQFASRGDGTHSNGTRLTTMTAASLRARWESKKINLGNNPLTVPAAPTLTGPSSPQDDPFDLTVDGVTDKAADWEWRLTTGGVAGSWVADATSVSSDSHSYNALTEEDYLVHARASNAAGTSNVSNPYTLRVNAPSSNPPSKAVIASGPPTQTVASTATFTFSASCATSLQTSLDGASFTTNTSPKTFTGLAPGFHTLVVHGTNTDGVGPNSDTYTWEVVATADVAAAVLDGTAIVDRVGKWAADASTSLPIQIPAGAVVGDLLLLFVGWAGTTPIGVPAGWTLVAQSSASTTLAGMTASRIFTGSEGTSITVTGPNANGGSGVIMNLGNVYSTNPILAQTTSHSE